MKLAPAALLVLAAVAQSPLAAAADDLVTAEAKQRMAEGKKLYGEGKYDAAWLKYVEACVVLKTDGCTRGLAFTAYKSGRYLAAYGYAKQLLEPKPSASLTPAVADELGRMKKDAYAKTGHIAIEAPAGAIVLVDEEMIGRAPLATAVDVDAAEHTVAANIGGRAAARRVVVSAGNVTRVQLEAPPADPAPPPSTIVASAPQTTSAVAPVETLDAPPPEARANPLRTWIPVGLGVGALALAGGGVYFTARASHDSDDASRLRSGLPSDACAGATSTASAPCAAIADAVHGSNNARTASVVMFGGAGVLAVGAALSFVLIPARTEGVRSAVIPMVGPGALGASWVATF
jgi:hypothetical protein